MERQAMKTLSSGRATFAGIPLPLPQMEARPGNRGVRNRKEGGLGRQVSMSSQGTLASEELVVRAGAWRVHRRFQILSVFFVVAAGASLVMEYRESDAGGIIALCVSMGALGILTDLLWGYRCCGVCERPLEKCCLAVCGCELQAISPGNNEWEGGWGGRMDEGLMDDMDGSMMRGDVVSAADGDDARGGGT